MSRLEVKPTASMIRGMITAAGAELTVHRVEAICEALGASVDRLPFTLRILLENLLRNEDGRSVTREQIEALVRWDPAATPDTEIAFRPSRVLLQDFTGVPCIVDLAAMRDAIAEMGGDPRRINPLQPVDLVIVHSVQVDEYGSSAAFLLNVRREFERNRERYQFLRWGQGEFDGSPRRAAGNGHRASGEPGVPRLGRDGDERRRPTPTRWSALTRTRR